MDFQEEFGGLIPHASSFIKGEEYHNNLKAERKTLADNHLHLIDKCIATKRTDLVPESELRALGKLALYSFANDSFFSFNFANNAMRKIEKMMNIAIAEAAFLKEVEANATKQDLCTEFASIYERFP